MLSRRFGTVLECMVLRERDSGKSRGFGFVTIAEDDKIEAILKQDHELDGRTLTVRRASPKSTAAGISSNEAQAGSCGSSNTAAVHSVRSGDTGRVGGYGGGFNEGCGGYSNCASAGCGSCGGSFGGFSSDPTLKKVFLGGLEGSMTEEAIRAACSNYGQVTDIQMMNDRDNPSVRTQMKLNTLTK